VREFGRADASNVSVPAAIDFRAQKARFCVAAQRPLADLRPAPIGGSGVWSDADGPSELGRLR